MKRLDTPRKRTRLTPKQRVLARFPSAYLVAIEAEDMWEWDRWAVQYRRPTRLTDGRLAEGRTPQIAWDEAERVMEKKNG